MEVMDAHTEATDFLMAPTDAPMEDMVAMDVATTARGRLRLLLRLRLLTDTDTDFLMEVMGAHTEATDFLMVALMDAPMEDMVATDVATTARGRLRLRLLLRLTLLTDTDTDFLMEVMDAHTEATDFLMAPTDAPMEDTVAMAGPMAAMVALTGMATESRQ